MIFIFFATERWINKSSDIFGTDCSSYKKKKKEEKGKNLI